MIIRLGKEIKGKINKNTFLWRDSWAHPFLKLL